MMSGVTGVSTPLFCWWNTMIYLIDLIDLIDCFGSGNFQQFQQFQIGVFLCACLPACVVPSRLEVDV